MKSPWGEMFRLDGRHALVTGGLGILGRHFVDALADMGATVSVVDLDGGASADFAAEISGRHGRPCLGFGCDVSDEAAVSDLAEAVEKAHGPVRILVNNAASKGRDLGAFLAPTETYALETWREVMSVNLDGLFLMGRAFGGRMVTAKIPGTIIQTSSIYGVMGPDFRIYEGSMYNGQPITTPAVYSASKAGVVGLTKYFATLWGEHGIRVNSLVPGGVSSGQNEEFDRKYSARVPMRRMAEPVDITGPLLFLASDASGYVTGQTLMADGGLSAW